VAGNNGQKELKTINTRILFHLNHGNKMRRGARGVARVVAHVGATWVRARGRGTHVKLQAPTRIPLLV
jgi:hypothetical protein